MHLVNDVPPSNSPESPDNPIGRIWRWLAAHVAAQPLTRKRVIAAYTVAITTDVIQLALLPFQLLPVVQFADTAAMVLTVWILGFHILLLPTFMLEFVPLLDMLPTWTGCVWLVIRQRRNQPPAPPASAKPPVIDI